MKKYLLKLICFFYCLQGYAFPPNVTLSNQVDMDFDVIEAGGLVGGAAELGTDGSISYFGDLSGGGVGVSGQVRANPVNGATLGEVSCSSTATLCNAFSNTLALSGVEVESFLFRNIYGLGNACAGVGNTVMVVPLNSTVQERLLFFGARLNVPAATVLTGDYSTAFACGTPINVEVVVP